MMREAKHLRRGAAEGSDYSKKKNRVMFLRKSMV
jgi:hypothetical protein